MPDPHISHFLLTRFNLLLWKKDKRGNAVRTVGWLEHRFALFERYCLPSVIGQSCRDFEWIVLFDSRTPERFRERIKALQARCPQLVPVFVEPENGRYFAQIFRDEVAGRLALRRSAGAAEDERVLTTYLDNDDALHPGFVEDLQRRAAALPDGTFVTYTHGYQFYTDYDYMLRIRYPNNHFISVVENGDAAALKTVYGYGSHYYLDRIKGVRIERVKDLPLWCEVIHEKNMSNDAYYMLGTRMVKDAGEFSFLLGDGILRHGLGVYLFRFLPRYLKMFVRRAWCKLLGRKW